MGLEIEPFCRMIITTKMLFSNVLGHAAELHYEKHLTENKINFEKAPTDKHYDYIVNGKLEQVKRWETDSTSQKTLGVNLVQTHGDRSGEGAFYTLQDFDDLILYDVGFKRFKEINIKKIPTNPKYKNYLIGRFKIERNEKEKIDGFDLEFLGALKFKNSEFPEAIEGLRKKYNLSYSQLLERCCNLTLTEIDSLFSDENFRLLTGVKGFAAEEHFNVFCEKRGINYKQMKEMYSKVDHLVNNKVRVQVKTPHLLSEDEEHYAFKTHKSHGSGLGELYKASEFDIVALFIGFNIDETKSKYLPRSVEEKFIFIPIKDLPRYPNHPELLKRISKVKRTDYLVNDTNLFHNF